MKYKYNDTVFLTGHGQVKVVAVNTNETYSNLTTYDLKDDINTFYSVCAERIERVQDDSMPALLSPEETMRALEILHEVDNQ